MSEKITVLSDKELDAVGAAGSLINASTNIFASFVKQTNYSSVKFSLGVGASQSNNVGTTIAIEL